MSKSEKEKLLLALDGVAAQLQTLRELVMTMNDDTKDDSNECKHQNIKEVRTMAGLVGAFCEDCGQEFSVGVSGNPIKDK